MSACLAMVNQSMSCSGAVFRWTVQRKAVTRTYFCKYFPKLKYVRSFSHSFSVKKMRALAREILKPYLNPSSAIKLRAGPSLRILVKRRLVLSLQPKRQAPENENMVIPVALKRIHHAAYRCIDARQTVEFYPRHLNMTFLLAIAEDEVPSTKEPDPYIHVFLDAGSGSILAFFEVPNAPPMGRDTNTPVWVQYIVFEVEALDVLLSAKTSLEEAGIEVVGPVEHTIFKSVYFFDPNGHRLELVVNTGQSGMLAELKRVAPAMLAEWSVTKRAPSHAAWLQGKGQLFGDPDNRDFTP
ncbi:MAG: catechol 2,3-dioxygenase-like lactoylglutathione lyase family enzyme [Lentisphaeria bacterium]|jgi:catechol 2,3-dioxygenase-like lactoylglutathione lyase family enzyme